MEADSPHRETPANLVHEFLIAMATLSRWSLLARGEFGDAEQRARALVSAPLVGLLAGIFLALTDRILAEFVAPMPRSLVVIVLLEAWPLGGMDLLGSRRSHSTRSRYRRATRVHRARRGSDRLERSPRLQRSTANCGVDLARMHDPASRSAAIVMSLMLSRWSLVPIAYGLRPLERWGLGVPYRGTDPLSRICRFARACARPPDGALRKRRARCPSSTALALTILALRFDAQPPARRRCRIRAGGRNGD